MRKMMAEFRGHRQFTAPWNLRLQTLVQQKSAAHLGGGRQHRSGIPRAPCRTALARVASVNWANWWGACKAPHWTCRARPWECTIIEGLEGNRFALFIKMHHSLIDGISGVKLLQHGMSTDREHSLHLPPFWASGKERTPMPPRKHMRR
jgi:diacylglycerol O-acyltransferase